LENNKKSSLLKKVLTILISLAFAALFMWLAVRGLDFKKLKDLLLKLIISGF
jgi:uncharacterized membrane protein YjgN (DUF898 family)